MKIEMKYFIYYGKSGRLQINFPLMEISFFRFDISDNWFDIIYNNEIYKVNLFKNSKNELQCDMYLASDLTKFGFDRKLLANFEVFDYKKNKFEV